MEKKNKFDEMRKFAMQRFFEMCMELEHGWLEPDF
jgi:hypothetical protein